MESSSSFLSELWHLVKDLLLFTVSGLGALAMLFVNRITKRQDKLEDSFEKLTESCHRFRVETTEKRMDLATKKDIESINERLNDIMKLYSKSIEHYESIKSILGFIVNNRDKKGKIYDGS